MTTSNTEKNLKLFKSFALLLFITGALLKIWHYDTAGFTIGTIGIVLWLFALVLIKTKSKKA